MMSTSSFHTPRIRGNTAFSFWEQHINCLPVHLDSKFPQLATTLFNSFCVPAQSANYFSTWGFLCFATRRDPGCPLFCIFYRLRTHHEEAWGGLIALNQIQTNWHSSRIEQTDFNWKALQFVHSIRTNSSSSPVCVDTPLQRSGDDCIWLVWGLRERSREWVLKGAR